MTTVERLEELKTVDIKEIERDSLPKYKDLISELDSRKSNKMEVLPGAALPLFSIPPEE